MYLRFTVLAIVASFGSGPCHADEDTQADVLMLALPAGAYLLTQRGDDRPGARGLTRSLAVTVAATLVLNASIDKDSPNGHSHDAFPSGHTSVAFASAAFMQKRYGWRPGVPAYLAASYVGWLRTETDDHDAADVLGAAALGILSSYWLTRPFDDNAQASLWTDGKSAGLQFELRW